MQNMNPLNQPLAYFITFTCYGTWLRGDESGSVDRAHNVPGTPQLPPDEKRKAGNRSLLDQPPYELDAERRKIVLDAVIEVCRYREWNLLAVHVRTNHVHVVVQSLAAPEKMMEDFKRIASRNLNREAVDTSERKRWTRHGSTRYLWKERDVQDAVQYVAHEQGDPMEVFVGAM